MKIWWLIIGMMLVTYLPRLVPFIALTGRPLPSFFQRCLLCLPYTALGALVIPGVIQATPGKPLAALAGIGAAAICSWFKGGLILSVFLGVVVTFLMISLL